MFSDRFKLERKRLRLTQSQIAKKIGISRSNVANWESGGNNPSVEMLFRCSEIFGCSVEYLAGYTNERNTTSAEELPPPEYVEVKDDDELTTLMLKNRHLLTKDDEDYIKFIINKRKDENKKG